MLFLLLTACVQECTLMGYESSLTLHVSVDGGDPVEDPTGTVTVGDTTVDFDCAVEGDGYGCSGSDVVIYFSGDAEDVAYEVHMPYYVGADMEAAVDWTTDEPNGEGCGTQYIGELDVVLFATP